MANSRCSASKSLNELAELDAESAPGILSRQKNGWRSCLTIARLSRDGLLHGANMTFGVLYGFFVIAYGRRQVLHFNVNAVSNQRMGTQQLPKRFPTTPRPAT